MRIRIVAVFPSERLEKSIVVIFLIRSRPSGKNCKKIAKIQPVMDVTTGGMNDGQAGNILTNLVTNLVAAMLLVCTPRNCM